MEKMLVFKQIREDAFYKTETVLTFTSDLKNYTTHFIKF